MRNDMEDYLIGYRRRHELDTLWATLALLVLFGTPVAVVFKVLGLL